MRRKLFLLGGYMYTTNVGQATVTPTLGSQGAVAPEQAQGQQQGQSTLSSSSTAGSADQSFFTKAWETVKKFCSNVIEFFKYCFTCGCVRGSSSNQTPGNNPPSQTQAGTPKNSA